jgi:predicted Zn-dependent protease
MFFRRKLLLWLPAALLALTPAALGQLNTTLPDLGDSGASELSLQTERRIGETIVRDIRLRDPQYLDDPEVTEYLNALGARLISSAPGARQDFDFFAMRDGSINAFALPGGFIGVHTGLISASDSESEVASVLAHEIAHVTQRHLARHVGLQKQMQLPMMAAMAAAILLGRSRPDLVQGAILGAQGTAVQTQLGYNRDFEREADRLGFQTLASAGFDARAMGTFFEKMQRYTRVQDDGSYPSYLRSHPVTTERITDAQNRASTTPYRQHADSLEYHLVRAKVRAEAGDARDAVTFFTGVVNDRRYASEAAARYGLAVAQLRSKEPARAQVEVERLRAAKVASPMIETLSARIRLAQGDTPGALGLLQAALQRYPHRRAILYASLEVLHDSGRLDEVHRTLAEPLRLYPRDPRLHQARAKAYAGQGKRLLQHQAQAEVYALNGSLPAAIEQLQLAQNSGEGNFYEMSVLESRLKELRAEHLREMQDSKKK